MLGFEPVREYFRLARFQEKHQKLIAEFMEHHNLAGDRNGLSSAMVSAANCLIFK